MATENTTEFTANLAHAFGLYRVMSNLSTEELSDYAYRAATLTTQINGILPTLSNIDASECGQLKDRRDACIQVNRIATQEIKDRRARDYEDETGQPYLPLEF